jgi:hypothetical protein
MKYTIEQVCDARQKIRALGFTDPETIDLIEKLILDEHERWYAALKENAVVVSHNPPERVAKAIKNKEQTIIDLERRRAVRILEESKEGIYGVVSKIISG